MGLWGNASQAFKFLLSTNCLNVSKRSAFSDLSIFFHEAENYELSGNPGCALRLEDGSQMVSGSKRLMKAACCILNLMNHFFWVLILPTFLSFLPNTSYSPIFPSQCYANFLLRLTCSILTLLYCQAGFKNDPSSSTTSLSFFPFLGPPPLRLPSPPPCPARPLSSLPVWNQSPRNGRSAKIQFALPF